MNASTLLLTAVILVSAGCASPQNGLAALTGDGTGTTSGDGSSSPASGSAGGSSARYSGGTGADTLDGAGTTTYGPISGISPDTGSEPQVLLVVGEAGDARRLYVKLATAPGAGQSWTFTLRDDGADTPLACKVEGMDTTCSDVDRSATIAAGSSLAMQITGSGAAKATRASWSFSL